MLQSSPAKLRDRLARDAVLRTSNESERSRIEGAEAILAHLPRAGPGEIRVWEAEGWGSGAALTFESAAATRDSRR